MILLVILVVVPTETFQHDVMRRGTCIENILTEIMMMRNFASVFCSTRVVSGLCRALSYRLRLQHSHYVSGELFVFKYR